MAHALLQQYQPSRDTPAAARQDVATYLVRIGQAALAPVAALLTSELVTNSILHATGTVTLLAVWADGRLRVDVSDRGGGTSPLRDSDEAGRGLHIVDAFATRWGSANIDGAGRATWFELERP